MFLELGLAHPLEAVVLEFMVAALLLTQSLANGTLMPTQSLHQLLIILWISHQVIK